MVKHHHVQDTGFGNGEVVFTTTFNPEPGRTYYYRACTWDGIHYNQSRRKSLLIDTGVRLLLPKVLWRTTHLMEMPMMQVDTGIMACFLEIILLH